MTACCAKKSSLKCLTELIILLKLLETAEKRAKKSVSKNVIYVGTPLTSIFLLTNWELVWSSDVSCCDLFFFSVVLPSHYLSSFTIHSPLCFLIHILLSSSSFSFPSLLLPLLLIPLLSSYSYSFPSLPLTYSLLFFFLSTPLSISSSFPLLLFLLIPFSSSSPLPSLFIPHSLSCCSFSFPSLLPLHFLRSN